MPFCRPTQKKEIEVGTAVAFGALDDEAPLASGTPDRAFEVVVVLPLPGAAAVPQGEHALYAVEEFGRDDSRVTAFVLLVLVRDNPDVVAVLQHLVDGVEGDGLFGLALGGTGRESGGGDDLMGSWGIE